MCVYLFIVIYRTKIRGFGSSQGSSRSQGEKSLKSKEIQRGKL